MSLAAPAPACRADRKPLCREHLQGSAPGSLYSLRRMSFYGRIGQFLFFLGFLGLVIFFASDQAGIPMYIYFCGGSLLFIAGIYLMWKYRNPFTPSDRFNTLRKMQQGRRVKRESLENSKYSQAEQRAKKEE